MVRRETTHGWKRSTRVVIWDKMSAESLVQEMIQKNSLNEMKAKYIGERKV